MGWNLLSAEQLQKPRWLSGVGRELREGEHHRERTRGTFEIPLKDTHAWHGVVVREPERSQAGPSLVPSLTHRNATHVARELYN